MRKAVLLLFVMVSFSFASATKIIDNFETGLDSWTSSASIGLDEWSRGSQSLRVTNYDETGWYVQLYNEDRIYEGEGTFGFWMYAASESTIPVKCTVYYDDLSVDSGYARPMEWEPDQWIFFECTEADRPISIVRIGITGNSVGAFYIDEVGIYNEVEPGVTGFAVTGANENVFPAFLVVCGIVAVSLFLLNKKKQ
jgi:hypothetical protein